MQPECFTDEIAIDFPSVGDVVERIRDAFLGERADDGIVRAELPLSVREAVVGLVAPLDVPVRGTCARCGGRGETWTETCPDCGGTGGALVCHRVRIAIPPGVPNGARFHVRLASPDAQSVRLEIRVAIRSSAA